MDEFNFDLRWYDWIVVNSSGGKDSVVMLDKVCELAKAAGVLDRVIVVHCDLGVAEWDGVMQLAKEQAARYGVAFRVVRRKQDLLGQVEGRGMWPGYASRFCTSDHKTKEVVKLMTALVRDWLAENELPSRQHRPERRVRILNCLGLRARRPASVTGRFVRQRENREGLSLHRHSRFPPMSRLEYRGPWRSFACRRACRMIRRGNPTKWSHNRAYRAPYRGPAGRSSHAERRRAVLLRHARSRCRGIEYIGYRIWDNSRERGPSSCNNGRASAGRDGDRSR